MKNILLVEGSTMFGRVIKKRLEETFDFPVFWVKTLKEAQYLLSHSRESFALALLDLNLTDAPRGEIIDEVVGRGIASIVLASNISAELRELIWSQKIADYILKDDPNSLDYIVSSLTRLIKNESTLVLLAEGDEDRRATLSEYLYVQRFRVLTAKNGKTALDSLARQENVRLLVTTHTLPDMSGCELCRQVRERWKFDALAVLGFYSQSTPEVGVQFLKSGATEIIGREDLLLEEFYCRVNRCVELIELHQ
ncbi:MAG: response regulator [Bacteroidetes bacterium]|jgi:PleD family two-component response regulator|nr:response regulator [Bacteroidota bacterium]